MEHVQVIVINLFSSCNSAYAIPGGSEGELQIYKLCTNMDINTSFLYRNYA